jgi:hypothetical protein
MDPVNLGNHTRTTAPPSERERIRRFYGEVLGCELKTPNPQIDVVRFANDSWMGIYYDAKALPPDQLALGCWLELKTADPVALQKKVVAFGVGQIDYPDKEHFYFHAPGGQIFRIASTHEP